MWRWDQGRLLYFQFDVLRDIAKTLVKFDNADISKCENLFRQTLVTETGMPFLPDYYTVKRNYSRVFQCSFLAKFMGNQIVVPTFEVFTSEPSDIEFIEGNRKRVEHFRVERSGLLKKYYKKVNPNPVCCACGADMSKRYPWTDYMLDIHHLLPLSSAVAISSSGTSLADIVGLCPSCHRAVHMYYRKWLRANEQADFKSKQEAHDVFVQATKEIA